MMVAVHVDEEEGTFREEEGESRRHALKLRNGMGREGMGVNCKECHSDYSDGSGLPVSRNSHSRVSQNSLML